MRTVARTAQPVMELWKRNLLIIWPTQFLSFASFTMILPFAPFYMQEMGVRDPARLTILVAIYAAAGPACLFVASPFWGSMADRFGRKLMVLRSHAAAAVVLAGMGMVGSPLYLIVFRMFQGLATGTVTAAQIMVAHTTPARRNGAAFGILGSAQNCGAMMGLAGGGILSHAYGYRVPCFVAAACQGLAFVLVLVGTRDTKIEPTIRAKGDPTLLAELRHALPLLALISIVIILKRLDEPYFPLFVQLLRFEEGDAALWTGWAGAAAGLAALIAGILCGHLADTVEVAVLVVAACIGAAFLLFLHPFLVGMGWLMAVRFGYGFVWGGLDTLVHVGLAKGTPENRRGITFGWAGSARSVGLMFGPIGGGLIVGAVGIRALFPIVAVLYLAMIPLMLRIMRRP